MIIAALPASNRLSPSPHPRAGAGGRRPLEVVSPPPTAAPAPGPRILGPNSLVIIVSAAKIARHRPPRRHTRAVRDPKISIGRARPNSAPTSPRFPPWEAFERRPHNSHDRPTRGRRPKPFTETVTPLKPTLENDLKRLRLRLRVFASRSRCKNSVGLCLSALCAGRMVRDRGEAAPQRGKHPCAVGLSQETGFAGHGPWARFKPMQKLRWTERGWSRGFSFGLWNFQSGLVRCRRLRGASRGLWTASSSPLRRSRGWRAADSLRFALASLEIGCAGPSVFVACPRHAGTTWCLSQETGFAGHGPWARFGESWRTNRRRPAPQQAQTRAASGFSRSADGSAGSALILSRGGVA